LQLYGDARKGSFCSFGVQRKIIIGVLAGGAQQLDLLRTASGIGNGRGRSGELRFATFGFNHLPITGLIE
jgi:hypothetical protein